MNIRIWVGLILVTVSSALFADHFSKIAEARQMLNYVVPPSWATDGFPVKIDISGYVKGEAIWDSRQNYDIREGQFLFFPLEQDYSVTGKDINKRGQFDNYAIQTRLRFEGFGPQVHSMDTRSYVEADFFGTTDLTTAGFRLRHAYLQLDSPQFTFLGGQTWHPMYFPVEAPDTVSFNTGTPINPYVRSPQFRAVYHSNHFDIIGAAMGFLNNRFYGPLGPSDDYFRNSMMPDFHIQARFNWENKSNTNDFAGIGVDVMRVVPRLVSNNNYKEVATITPVSAVAYTRISHKDLFTFYAKLTYAQNASTWDMIGGYAVHTVDPVTDIRSYTPFQTVSLWSEFIVLGDVEPAFFIGYAKNIGATKSIIQQIGTEQTVYGIGTNINDIFRASPRVRWYIKAFVLSIEVEYTRATYGTLNTYGKIENSIPVGNTRFLFASYYIF